MFVLGAVRVKEKGQIKGNYLENKLEKAYMKNRGNAMTTCSYATVQKVLAVVSNNYYNDNK